jgi:hypothetical protein
MKNFLRLNVRRSRVPARQLGARRSRSGERGVAISELAVGLPILLILAMAIVDFGRFIYCNQVVNDLVREAGMLVSRGATYEETFDATFRADGPLDVRASGLVVISRIRRQSPGNATPWIVDQEQSGALSGISSRLGSRGGPAALPEIKTLEPGVTLMAVEISHAYAPLFPITLLGLNFYPDRIYNLALF